MGNLVEIVNAEVVTFALGLNYKAMLRQEEHGFIYVLPHQLMKQLRVKLIQLKQTQSL